MIECLKVRESRNLSFRKLEKRENLGSFVKDVEKFVGAPLSLFTESGMEIFWLRNFLCGHDVQKFGFRDEIGVDLVKYRRNLRDIQGKMREF